MKLSLEIVGVGDVRLVCLTRHPSFKGHKDKALEITLKNVFIFDRRAQTANFDTELTVPTGTIHVDPGVKLKLENVQFHSPQMYAVNAKGAKVGMYGCVIKDCFAAIRATHGSTLFLYDCDVVGHRGISQ